MSDLSSFADQDYNDMNATDIGVAEGDITEWLIESFKTVHAVEFINDANSILKKTFYNNDDVTREKADLGII